MSSNLGKVFIDISLGTLHAIYWPPDQEQEQVYSDVLTRESPLSKVLPDIWSQLGHNQPLKQFFKNVQNIYVLRGPGSLTSLRVFFAHLMGLSSVFPHIQVFALETPVWLQKILGNLNISIPKNFMFQVGRFAYVGGNCSDVTSYKTFHLYNAEEWAKCLLKFDKQNTILLLAQSIPEALKDHKVFWLHQGFSISSECVLKSLSNFRKVESLDKLKPIQPPSTE